jgi:hypothetical protein
MGTLQIPASVLEQVAARSLLKASLPLKYIFIALFTFLLRGDLAGKKC